MELGEGASVATIKVDPDKYLKARVTKVRFKGTYRACREKKEIDPNDWHWPAGKPDGYKKSKKAVVYQVKKDKTPTATVMLKIDSKGMSGNGKFTGTIGKLVFEGQTPLASGEHEVTVTLKEMPEFLHWARGMMTWEIDAGERAALAGVTQVELFFVFDDPASTKFFDPDGVWIEALRFIFKEARLEGTKQIKEGLGKVTQGCFALKTNLYEIKNGKRNFGGATTKFNLAKYMKPAPRQDKAEDDFVNCYDQAYAVVVFGGALGVTVGALFLEPFGFLKQTQLVGRGTCNNPFPTDKYNAEVGRYHARRAVASAVGKLFTEALPVLTDFLLVDAKDPDRSGFGNHMFCEHNTKIYDACAGPAQGAHDRTGYMVNSIDTNTPENVRGFPKTEADIRSNAIDRGKLTDYTAAVIRGRTYDLEVKEVE